jgi:hypothetical protein
MNRWIYALHISNVKKFFYHNAIILELVEIAEPLRQNHLMLTSCQFRHSRHGLLAKPTSVWPNKLQMKLTQLTWAAVDRIMFKLITDFIVILRGEHNLNAQYSLQRRNWCSFNILHENMQTRSRLQVSSSLHVYFWNAWMFKFMQLQGMSWGNSRGNF